MRKKITALFFILVMTLSMSACGNDIIIDVVTNDTEGQTLETASTESEAAATQPQTAAENPAGSVEEISAENPAGMPVIAKEDLKIGVLYIGGADDTSGYTYAHEIGIQGMVSNIGLDSSQIVRKEFIDDGDTVAVTQALQECMDEGCNVVFTTSWGYMD